MKRTALALVILSAAGHAAAVDYATVPYVDGEIQRIGGYTTGNSIAVQVLDQRQSSTEAQVSSLNRELGNTNDRITRTDAELVQTKTDLNAVNQQVQKVGRDTEGNSVAIGIIDGRQKADRADINTLQGQQSNTAQQTTTNTAAISGVAAVQAQQAQTLNEYGTRMDQQSQATAAMDSKFSQKWLAQDGLNQRFDQQIKEAQNMGAAAYAAASLQFCTQVECGFQIGAAGSTMNGRQGMAIGAGGALNNKWAAFGTAVTAGSVRGASVSVTYSLR